MWKDHLYKKLALVILKHRAFNHEVKNAILYNEKEK